MRPTCPGESCGVLLTIHNCSYSHRGCRKIVAKMRSRQEREAARCASALMGIPDWWEDRHREALTAWEQGDVERLCDICIREIRSAARRFSQAKPSEAAPQS